MDLSPLQIQLHVSIDKFTCISSSSGVYCGAPPQVLNSHRSVSGHYFNDTVIYTCHTGFILRGKGTITCQSDSHWSTPPECQG